MKKRRDPTRIMLSPEMNSDFFVSIGGHEFDLAGIEPYVRVDGSPSHVAVWTTTCSRCGTPCIVRSALRFSDLKKTCGCQVVS